MFYYPPNNQYIQEGTAFEIDGVQYPANWLNLSTPEEKAELGLEEVITTNSPADQRYYWVSEELNGAELTYINTPKDLGQCKEVAISQTNAVAYSLLSPSDWMVPRAVETGTPVSLDWANYREAVRAAAANAKDAINTCTTVDDLAALEVIWPTSPELTSSVPFSVSPLQAKAELLERELLDEVEAIINGAGNPLLPLAWNTASDFARQSPMILGVAQAMNWDDAYLDDLFIQASKRTF